MARIEVDCERIRRNTEAIVAMCAVQGIEVVGVTKACCGHPEVARAMLAGGVSMLAESRLENVRWLREAGIDASIMLLRLPALSKVDQVVQLAQVSLNTQVETVRALSRAARARGLTHQVILMVETGDRREGVMPERALDVARQCVGLPNVELAGIGTNLTCIGGVLPTRENAQLLLDVAEHIERSLGIAFRIISAGNSATLALVLRREMPRMSTSGRMSTSVAHAQADRDVLIAPIHQLRIGGAILIGEVDSTGDWPSAIPHQDAFRVVAEVIEVETKPSVPEGPVAPNAFGEIPRWEDLGPRRRAILGLGRQDVQVEGLLPKRPGVTPVGASSDHLVVDVTEADPQVYLGEELEFRPLYGAVATAMASRAVTHFVKPCRA